MKIRQEERKKYSRSAVCVGTCSTSELNWCLMTAVFNCTTKAGKLPLNGEWTDSLNPEGFLDKCDLTCPILQKHFLSDPVDRQTNRMAEVVISCLVILLHCSTNANKRLCTRHPVIIQITLFKNWWWLLHSALVHLQVYPLFSVSRGYCGPVTAIWSVLQAVPH